MKEQMKKPKFYNKAGLPTEYAFSCGYTIREEANDRWKEMFMDHKHLNVRSGVANKRYTDWKVFNENKLRKARKFYKSIRL